MKNLKLNKTIPALLLALPAFAQSPDRITAIHFNKGKVERIYMAPGLATAVTFPCDLDEATVGRDEDLKAKVSPTSKKQLTLFLSSSASLPTNMIVRCGDRQELYVFDVVPSRTSHQDVVRIHGSYGGAGLRDNNLQLIDSDKDAKRALEEKKNRRRIDPSTVVLKESSSSYKQASKKPAIIELQKPQEIKPQEESRQAPVVSTDPKTLETRRPVILVEKPQLVEEEVRLQQREDFKRTLTGAELPKGEQQ